MMVPKSTETNIEKCIIQTKLTLQSNEILYLYKLQVSHSFQENIKLNVLNDICMNKVRNKYRNEKYKIVYKFINKYFMQFNHLLNYRGNITMYNNQSIVVFHSIV